MPGNISRAHSRARNDSAELFRFLDVEIVKSMRAVHVGDGQVRLITRRIPRRPPGFSLVRLLTGGICNTDLELLRGYYGFRGVPGHEFVGEVVESDSPALMGKRVVGEINLACGSCDWCARDLGRHCPFRRVLGIVRQPGAFEEL